jgi:hypothetical protein
MTYNEKKSLYESIMKQISKDVKHRINEANLILMGSDGKPYGWGLFVGLKTALEAQYQKVQRALKNGEHPKGLYIYTRNDDLMNAATLVLFNGSVKQYGVCTHGGIEESLLSKCKKTTRYIIISEIDDDLKTPNDKQMLSLIANIVDGRVRDCSYNLTVALVGTVPFENLPNPFKQRFEEYVLEY